MKFLVNILKLFARFGLPGLALGVFFLLFLRYKWDFEKIPSSWSGPIAFLFLILIAIIVILIIIIEKRPPDETSTSKHDSSSNNETGFYTWNEIHLAVNRMVNEIREDNFSPTIIFGLGRGGAIVGGLIAGALGNRPLIVLNLEYRWKNGSRSEELSESVKINTNLNDVLLVTGEVRSGNSMRFCSDYLRELGARKIKKATFHFLDTSTERIDYIGVRSFNANYRLPWMTDNYERGYTATQ